MDTSKWPYLLVVQGENIKNDSSGQRFFLHRGYFDRLDDALVKLMKMDLALFEPVIATNRQEPGEWYRAACITATANGGKLVEILRRPIGHREADALEPGLYVKFHTDLMEFEYLFDGLLYDLVTGEDETSYLMLARYRYDDSLQLIRNPLLRNWKAANGDLSFNVTAELPIWNYALWVKSTCHAENLADQTTLPAPLTAPLLCYDAYQFKELKDAFWSLVCMDFYKMDRDMVLQRRLDVEIHHTYIIGHNEMPVVEIEHITPSPAAGRQASTDSGVFLFFNMEQTRLQQLTGIDLSMFQSVQLQHSWQLLAYTADGNDFVTTEQMRSLFSARNLQPLAPHSRPIASAAPYYLQITRADTGTGENVSSQHPAADLRQFSSMQAAFEALLHIDPDQFLAELQQQSGRETYITCAKVVDAADHKPVWSKFSIQLESNHMPSDVYIQLHDQKITFESIQLTLYHFSAIAGAKGLYFMAGKAGRNVTGNPPRKIPKGPRPG